MSHATDRIKLRIKEAIGRRAIVYGGGLSTPLLLINLDSQTGAPSSDAENVLHRTDTAVARSNIAVANKTE